MHVTTAYAPELVDFFFALPSTSISHVTVPEPLFCAETVSTEKSGALNAFRHGTGAPSCCSCPLGIEYVINALEADPLTLYTIWCWPVVGFGIVGVAGGLGTAGGAAGGVAGSGALLAGAHPERRSTARAGGVSRMSV